MQGSLTPRLGHCSGLPVQHHPGLNLSRSKSNIVAFGFYYAKPVPAPPLPLSLPPSPSLPPSGLWGWGERPMCYMSKYLKVANGTNKLLNKICSNFLP